MKALNVDVGVLRALKAYKSNQGMSAEEADAWAQANLDEGIALWTTTYKRASRMNEYLRARPDLVLIPDDDPEGEKLEVVTSEEIVEVAFEALRVWASAS